MKLRKTDFTKVKQKNGKYKESPTSYHEISIPDIYIKQAGWSKNDELTAQVFKIDGSNAIILKNISKVSEIMEFKTFQ
jgi:hypothetical protein